MVRLQPEQLAILDDWRALGGAKPVSRPEAIRRLLKAAIGEAKVDIERTRALRMMLGDGS